ncbi:MAG: YgiQ family radical SAM protein [Deltaproteobacteria bacterium]|nr:YgiQ family radical SAM protein [Candidatus Anaeroferrophillus wilburensis]MBN2887951.1 YgiQ family radical SAM protein [Deltaproteobacteria bacterium]
MFLPTTSAEVERLGWSSLDVILITGDTYIDSPFIGAAVIGKVLVNAGFRVGIIAQPDIDSNRDICRLGEPVLFWGVSGGSVDSMVANYTANGRRRHQDDLTPGGENTRRPDRAVIVYTNLIRRHYKNTRPIVLGGIEASLRRLVHYDFWSNRIRKSILFNAKADLLAYGMGEATMVALAKRLQAGQPAEDLPGLCYRTNMPPPAYLELPAYDEITDNHQAFIDMFHLFYRNQDHLTARGLVQRQDDRYLVHNPPAPPLTQQELDQVYSLDFERDIHPFYRQQGKVRALETIQFSLTTHRGCYGACDFCAIAVHQGQTVHWRSEASLVAEAQQLTKHPRFKGIILDVGGPTANMYGFECGKKTTKGVCTDKRCLYPSVCGHLPVQHQSQIRLLKKLRQLPGIKHVFVASGVRHDLVLADQQTGILYLEELVKHHVSGQLKVAPEHSEPEVLALMGKPEIGQLLTFKDHFDRLTRKAGKKQFLSYYLIAAYPGCTTDHMHQLHTFTTRHLHIRPEQVQIFTPTPSTYASLMYHTEKNPFTGSNIFVEKNQAGKIGQKEIITGNRQQQQKSRSAAAQKRH